MHPSVKFLLKRITTIVVITFAIAAVFDWTGLSH